MKRRSIFLVGVLVLTLVGATSATAEPISHGASRLEAWEALAQSSEPRPSAEPTRCVNGMAGEFPCRNVDLLSHIGLNELGASFVNEVWGWTDPVTRRDYAIIGGIEGTWVIDIGSPVRPFVVGHLPSHSTVGGQFWRDIKVYADHAFIGSEHTGHGIQVLDLTQVREVSRQDAPVVWENTAHYSGVSTSHNVAINEDTGFLYILGSNTCAGGLHMVDISDPVSPSFAGCWADDGFVHDTQCVLYHGPDAAYRGRELCFNSTGPPDDTTADQRVGIVDVTDKANPTLVGSRSYPMQAHSHQGWLTPGHDYFLHGDEQDELIYGHNTKTRIFDVRNLSAPELIGEFVNPNTPSIDHNMYIEGRFTYQANYSAGLRVYSNGNVADGELEEIAYFDVYPEDDGTHFNGGSWSNYPFFRRKNVVAVSSMDRGFFLLRVRLAGGGTD